MQQKRDEHGASSVVSSLTCQLPEGPRRAMNTDMCNKRPTPNAATYGAHIVGATSPHAAPTHALTSSHVLTCGIVGHGTPFLDAVQVIQNSVRQCSNIYGSPRTGGGGAHLGHHGEGLTWGHRGAA